MSLPLPIMNNLCKRWILPPLIQQACDFYFLKNLDDNSFVQVLQAEEGNLFIQEYGIKFQVIFMYDSLQVYVKNGELAKRQEPNNTAYWCSFRSITFDFQGVSCTKSYVLVQVDKGKETKDLVGQGARMAKPDAAGETSIHQLRATNPVVSKAFRTFAEASQVEDKEEGEE